VWPSKAGLMKANLSYSHCSFQNQPLAVFQRRPGPFIPIVW
jgi:hypothetical protein